jgi:hypothetical protein
MNTIEEAFAPTQRTAADERTDALVAANRSSISVYDALKAVKLMRGDLREETNSEKRRSIRDMLVELAENALSAVSENEDALVLSTLVPLFESAA